MEQSEPIRIKVRLTVQDFHRANLALLPRTTRVLYWLVEAAAILGLSFIAYVAALGHRRPEAGSLFIVALPLILLATFVPIIRFAIPYLTAKQAMKNPGVKEGSQYSFAPSGIQLVGATGRSELTWQAIAKVRETESEFLVYPQPNIAHILPKRCFSSEAEIAAFRSLVREHVAEVQLLG